MCSKILIFLIFVGCVPYPTNELVDLGHLAVAFRLTRIRLHLAV
jgi:hypothetical protein